MYQPYQIQATFAAIAKQYDLANSINSLGLHRLWNRRLVKSVASSTHLLDLCAGTGEIAFAFLKRYPQAKATLVDFCPEMLEIAQQKATPFKGRCEMVCGDVMDLPFPSSSYDGATISYGIRNVKEPIRCFEQVYRLLKTGAPFAILELTRPNLAILRLLHRLYTKIVLPITGKLLTNNREAYDYLAESVQTFVSPQSLCKQLQSVGFKAIRIQPLNCGIATLITCNKKN